MARKVEFTFNPEEETGLKIPASLKEETRQEIADFLLEQVLQYAEEGRSVEDGSKWDKLSAGYKKFKEKEGAGGKANLQLSGDMLDALSAKVVGAKIQIKVAASEADKADGHCNHSGESPLPERVFVPRDSLDTDILRGVREIIESAIEAAS